MERKRKTKTRRISGSTWFGVVGIIGLLVGIILPTYFYFHTRVERELVYAVNPVRTAVVTAGQASELSVFHEGEPLGDVNVTAAQVAIWNAGKQSIREEDILRPIVISTDPPVPILEVSIRQRSREVTEFNLVGTPESLASGRVPVSWYILEKDDGASIQLIYEGTQDVNFRVEGVIEGRHEIKDVELGVSIKTPQEQVSEQESGRWAYGIMALASGLALVIIFVFLVVRRKWREYWLPMVGFLPFFGMSVWQYFSISTRLWPPFGF
ncbi:MAG: hypothetical protein A2Z76_04320 [Chloroflexi bacterium RBG_13_56_8b]|nr:MAG: hypothetical protein A2Z76_04320 [Chloroflexi bacterium RBG_13_56_8b]